MTATKEVTTHTQENKRLLRSSKLFKTIIDAIRNKKGEHIVSLDLRKIDEAVADFFIICEANSTLQIKAIADEIGFQVEQVTGEVPYKEEGRQALQWVLIDYVNVVVHIFHPEARQFYKLEEMWSDAALLKHTEQ